MVKSRSTTEDVSVERSARSEEYTDAGRRHDADDDYVLRRARRVRGGITAYPLPTPEPAPRQEWEALLRHESVREALYGLDAALQAASATEATSIGPIVIGSFQRRTSARGLPDIDMVSTWHGQVWSGQVKTLEMPDLPNLIDLTAILADVTLPEGMQLLYEGRSVADAEFWKYALTREVQARIINGVTELVTWLTELEQVRNALVHGLKSASEPARAIRSEVPEAATASPPASTAIINDMSSGSDDVCVQTDAPLEEALSDEHPQLLAMYREANTVGLREVTVRLRELFSSKELAYMADTSTRTIRNWLAGAVEQARPEAAGRLRAAFTSMLILQQEEAPSVIKNWFTNTNPYLDFHAPAQVIRDGQLREAIKAARVYAEYAGA